METTLSDNEVDPDVRAFFTQRKVDLEELQAVKPVISRALIRAIEIFESQGTVVLLEQQQEEQEDPDNDEKLLPEEAAAARELQWKEDAKVKGSARDYQTKLFEIAKQRNTIVHLGTGMGKTFVAIMLLKEFAARGSGSAVFLVPSVALAVQQTDTLSANLPLNVQTASQFTVVSASSRQRLAECDVLVATHGAYYELLKTYGDLFSMERLNLLIIDECHHCTGNSPYVSILQNFYHTTPPELRPRVLGLTASPLINFKQSLPPHELDRLVQDLESMMDSKIVSMKALGIHESHAVSYLNRDVREEILTYDNEGREPSYYNSAKYDKAKVNKCRYKDFNQLEKLFVDLGPFVVGLYCQAATQEMTRNEFEEETPEQFQSAVDHLQSIASWCKTHSTRAGGRSQKLIMLENLLARELRKDPSAVGLLFVERRITAAALNIYFRSQHHALNVDIRPRESDTPSKSVDYIDSLDKDQYMDADEDIDVDLRNEETDEVAPDFDDQFADASDDYHVDIYDTQQFAKKKSLVETVLAVTSLSIRPVVLMRQQGSRKVYGNRMPAKLANEIWTKERDDIADAIRGLRCNEYNLLIATAVVEEGIDIQTCNFVVVFDTLKALKSYVQMKGRARQRNAAVFVFEEQASSGSLSKVQGTERRLCEFLVEREYANPNDENEYNSLKLNRTRINNYVEPDQIEMLALREGRYSTGNATLWVKDAKSLLYQFAVGQPLEVVSRASRTTFESYFPFFDDVANTLVMPAYLCSSQDLRKVRLPPVYAESNKKVREQVLCFLACIRLHARGLLNDRLKPLAKDDIKRRVLDAVSIRLKETVTVNVNPILGPQNETDTWFVTPLLQTGILLNKCKKTLRSEDIMVGLLSRQPLPEVGPLALQHKEFGEVCIQLGRAYEICPSDSDLETATEFFATTFNARWKRRKRAHFFRSRGIVGKNSTLTDYGLLLIETETPKILWKKMREVISEAKRDENCRRETVKHKTARGSMDGPRLWSPIYDPFAVYIALRPSGFCSDVFPDMQFNSFVEFFQNKKEGVKVSPDAELYDCQQLWDLPRKITETDEQSRKRRFDSSEGREDENNDSFITGLRRVKLPPSICFELPLADPGVCLLHLFIPQFLYHMESYITIMEFLQHCRTALPRSVDRFEQIAAGKLIASLSTKGYNAELSYEKLEWLGDAVLKLVLSDALVHSSELSSWIQVLSEGYLSAARDSLACNATLTDACKALGLDKFILFRSLSRGKWAPAPLSLVDSDGTATEEKPPSGKVCADVVEALIGLVYTEFDIEACRVLVAEMGLIPFQNGSKHIPPTEGIVMPNQKLETARKFTGQSTFNNTGLVEEAFCHPTALGTRTPSYQRLEWIGDAVLCLAAREWIYKMFPDRSVGDMVVTEALLDSNEALAFLSKRAGLYKFLDHRDQTLQTRIEQYAAELTSKQGGLWGTAPPKPLADVVESLLGLVHVDRGFKAAQNAALHILSPILGVLKSTPETQILVHPMARLKALSGRLISIDFFDGESFSKKFSETDAWDGYSWQRPGKRQAVARIHCFDETIVAACGISKAAARALVCSLFLAVTQETPKLMERCLEARGIVERGVDISNDQIDNA